MHVPRRCLLACSHLVLIWVIQLRMRGCIIHWSGAQYLLHVYKWDLEHAPGTWYLSNTPVTCCVLHLCSPQTITISRLCAAAPVRFCQLQRSTAMQEAIHHVLMMQHWPIGYSIHISACPACRPLAHAMHITLNMTVHMWLGLSDASPTEEVCRSLDHPWLLLQRTASAAEGSIL